MTLQALPRDIKPRQSEINTVYKLIFPATPEKHREEKAPLPCVHQLTDAQIKEKAFKAANGAKMQALDNGDISGYPSHSDADLAFCSGLAFWTGKDAARMDRLFRSSGLMRDKWDRKVKGNMTYGQMTIQKAIESCQNIYEPPINGKPIHRTQSEESRIIEKINQEYAVVGVGGKCRIMREYYDPAFEREDIIFSPITDFHAFHSNKIHKIITPEGKTKTITHSKLWMLSPRRREFKGIVFAPPSKEKKAPLPPDYYNLWRGFGIDPKPGGDWSLYRDHVFRIICNCNEAHYHWVMAWLARMVQDPGGDRPGTAIVMKGLKGTGKGTFCHPLRLIFGRHYLQVFNQRQLTGNFNSHLKDKNCVFADEAVWGGDKKEEGVLKGLTTEPTIPIEGKGQDLIEVRNHINLIMATNNDWGVPASFDERRFFVTELSDERRGDQPYFKAIRAQLDNGGAETMLYDLQRMDISGIDLRTPPKTAALLDQIECTLPPVQKWWYQRLNDGENLHAKGQWLYEIEKGMLYDDFQYFCRSLNLRGPVISRTQFGKRLKAIAPSIYGGARNNSIPGRPWVYQFNTLDEHRGEIEAVLKFTPEWETPLS